MLEVIAAAQFATGASFAIIGLAAYRYGRAGQGAAEAEVVRQGFPVELLARHRIRIEESLAELMFPLGMALALLVLAALNLTAPAIGRTATWILQPLLLVAGGFITAAQVFVTRFTVSAFRKSNDPDAQRVDVAKVLAAATAAFPRWLRPLIVIRFILVTAGSVLILALLFAGA